MIIGMGKIQLQLEKVINKHTDQNKTQMKLKI